MQHQILVICRLIIFMPVLDIGAEGIEQNITAVRQQRLHIVLPSLRIPHQILKTSLRKVDVSPGMGGKFIAVRLQGPGQFLHRFPIRRYVLIRCVVRIIVLRIRIIGLIRPIPQYAVVAGEGQNRLVSVIAEVRMLLHEGIQDRHQIIVADGDIALRIRILQLRSAVRIQYHLIRKTPALHILIVADIILGNHNGLLPLRQQNLLLHHVLGAVRIGLRRRDVMKPHQHIAARIKLLQNGLKLRNRGHSGIEVVPQPVIRQCPGLVHNQRVHKNVGDFLIVRRNTGRPGLRIRGHRRLHLRILRISGRRQQRDGAVIIILLRLQSRLRQQLLLLIPRRLRFLHRRARRLGLRHGILREMSSAPQPDNAKEQHRAAQQQKPSPARRPSALLLPFPSCLSSLLHAKTKCGLFICTRLEGISLRICHSVLVILHIHTSFSHTLSAFSAPLL